jgi:hypothetical protein
MALSQLLSIKYCMTMHSFLKSIAIIFTLALAFSPLTISTAQAAVKIGSYVGNWKPSITYAGGDLITYSNKTFLSLVAKNKAKDPNSNPKAWQVFGGGSIGSLGTATGDMQWWNGSKWVMIPVGANNTTLKNCNGIPTWVTSAASCPFLIGDIGPAGGIVFYIADATGKHGLEAAPTDQSPGIPWGCYGTEVGGTSVAVGGGKANTIAINTVCGTGTAAQIATNYSLNGFSDWYLPSKDELNLLYEQKALVGSFSNYLYWSSTEPNGSSAWSQDFVNGNLYVPTKIQLFPVRAIRYF